LEYFAHVYPYMTFTAKGNVSLRSLRESCFNCRGISRCCCLSSARRAFIKTSNPELHEDEQKQRYIGPSNLFEHKRCGLAGQSTAPLTTAERERDIIFIELNWLVRRCWEDKERERHLPPADDHVCPFLKRSSWSSFDFMPSAGGFSLRAV
jgi:hypothetical protein